jgi:ral guanine nucleotide dissociation stimulator-like 1
VLYKSIMLSNNERTPQVIRNAMLKLGLEGNPDSYTLAQVLPDRGKLGETTLLTNALSF